MDMQIANTILEQLGGRRFIVMTGAKNFVGGTDSLSFSLPRNASNCNKMRITLTPADTYTVDMFKIRAGKFENPVTRENVYCDQLQDVFTSVTGMYASLGTMGRS
jgi:hypothetical protein